MTTIQTKFSHSTCVFLCVLVCGRECQNDRNYKGVRSVKGHANMSVLCVLCTRSYIPESVKNKFDVFRTFGRHPQALRLLSYVFAVWVLRRFEVNKTTRPTRTLLHAIRQSIIACQLINDSRLFSLYPVHPLFRHLNSPMDPDISMTYTFSATFHLTAKNKRFCKTTSSLIISGHPFSTLFTQWVLSSVLMQKHATKVIFQVIRHSTDEMSLHLILRLVTMIGIEIGTHYTTGCGIKSINHLSMITSENIQ